MTTIQLRPSIEEDIHHFFTFQLDAEANYLAAFTAKDPTDKTAYLEKYTKLLHNPTVNMQTIVACDRVIGTVTKFEIEGDAEVAFLDRQILLGKRCGNKSFTDVSQHRTQTTSLRTRCV